MSTSDGTVIGTAQIFGNAPRNRAFNLVLLAEGFTKAQQNDFNNACTAFVTAFRATPPFDELSPAINIFRVNVSSTDSGADDPTSAGGTGASVRTYFDATFGANNIRRLLVCNTSTALQVAAAQVPEFTVVLVVVNSTVYGGSGGSVGTYSLASAPRSPSMRWGTLPSASLTNTRFTPGAMRRVMITIRWASRQNLTLLPMPTATH